MELKLKKDELSFYEPVNPTPFSCETLREHIVPDSCADIARIVQTTGQVWVTGLDAGVEGMLCADGTVDVTVLYIPEKGADVCALHIQIPFHGQSDFRWTADDAFPEICGKLRMVEARVLNPRKILIRANIELYPTLCRGVTLSVCTGAEADLQILPCQKEMRYIAAVREREFTFTEDLPLSVQHGGVEEILYHREDIRGTDCKLIGSKLVVKGVVFAAILYRGADGHTDLLRQEVPFSQVLDGSGVEEEWEFQCTYRLMRSDCVPCNEGGFDDRHTLTLTMQLHSRVAVWRREKVTFIADLYSTEEDVVLRTDEIVLHECCRGNTKRHNIRRLVETGNVVKAVLDTEVGCPSVIFAADGGSAELPLWARCLYLDEADILHAVQCDFSASVPAETSDAGSPEGEACCGTEVMVSILPDGIELRFPVECTFESSATKRYISVCGAETAQEERGDAVRPSVILKVVGQGETLWSVAKECRTTCDAILAANDLPDEDHIPADKLLLIPRSR